MTDKQYLVQIFEHSHCGNYFIEEKVVDGNKGIKQFLEKHTFTDKVIDEVILNHYFKGMCDLIEIKKQNEDGSFDSYCEL